MKTRHPFMNKKVEIPNGKEMDVQNIHNWLAHQPHLPKLTDEHVLLFLHSCCYSGERTKDTIDNYFTVRAQCPDLFGGWQLDKMQELWNIFLMAPLPKTTPENYRLLIYRLHDTDPAKFNFQEALRAFFSYNDIRISEDGLVEGYIVIFDMKGYSLGHLARMSTNMNLLRKFMVYIQGQYGPEDEGHPLKPVNLNNRELVANKKEDCHPVRLKGIHVINTVPIIDSCLAVVKPLMQSEIMQLLHLHSDLSTLEKFVPLELMPSDYGGMAPDSVTLHEDHVKTVCKHYKDWLLDSEKLKADMKKRISKPKNEIIELEGSFKTLEVD